MSENLDAIFQSIHTEDLKKKILDEIFSEENLYAKTELDKPMNFSILQSLNEVLITHKLEQSSHILTNFINTSFKYMISKDRKGRQEYIDAFKSLNNVIEDSGLQQERPPLV